MSYWNAAGLLSDNSAIKSDESAGDHCTALMASPGKFVQIGVI